MFIYQKSRNIICLCYLSSSKRALCAAPDFFWPRGAKGWASVQGRKSSSSLGNV
ncbi:hypothetical protein Plhal304r1_c049g0131571 [Plasmopara halstedii]